MTAVTRFAGFLGRVGGVLFSTLANETAEPVDKGAKADNRLEVDTGLDVRLPMSGLCAVERHWMITLLIGTFVMAGVGMGWYGHKASLRIDAWGKKENECDRIFQQVGEPEDGTELWAGGQRTVVDPVRGKALATSHFAIGAVALK